MQRYFAKIENADDVGELIHMGCAMTAEQGVVRQSYHSLAPFESATSMKAAIYTRGFSDEWLKLYNDENFRANDPIPKRILENGMMMTWQQAMKAEENSPAEREYFEAMERHGLKHGFGVPLFGLYACDAYAAFDFDIPIEEVSDAKLGMVRALSQMVHQRICVLIKRSEKSYDLSERETEVLEWLARGKSVWAVAAILDISPDTVKTYCKRIYAKLGVSDRVGAVVKALKLGLVKI